MKRNALTLILAVLVSLWSLDSAWSAIRCVRPGFALCFQTIQDAVNAANPGDIIVVTPNPNIKGYRENVVINTPNLTITGVSLLLFIDDKFDCSRVVVDGCETPADPTSCGSAPGGVGDGFTINANGVTIKNLTIRHFNQGVLIFANNTTIQNVCFVEDGSNDGVVDADDGVNARNNIKVIKSQFRTGNGRPISIRGNDALVWQNQMLTFDNGGMDIFGDRFQVKENTIKTSNDSECIETDGNDGLITGNSIEGCEPDCIDQVGSNTTISFNTLKDCLFDGIVADGDDNKIENNSIKQCGQDGVDTSGDRVRVALNTIEGMPAQSGNGIEYDGDRPDIYKNTIISTDKEGIDLFCFSSGGPSTCTGGSVKENTVRFAFDDADGMEIDGFNLRIEYNIITDTSESGLNYNGDFGTIYWNTIERAGTEDRNEDGFDISGNNNMITNNTARDNRFSGITNDSGSNNTYRGNLSEKNGMSGIRIEDGSDNIVDRNRTLNNNGEGINNSGTATSTDVTNNTSLGNRTDICNVPPGTISPFTGNVFVTGGTATPCVVEQL